MWYDQSELKSYKDIATYFSKCRSPEKGRPLKAWGRVFKRGDDYEVQANGDKLCVVTPDNIVTFVAPISAVRRNAQTLVGAFHRAMPLSLLRVGTGRYRIAHLDKAKEQAVGGYWNWKWMQSEAPEYFEGIQFDLATGECLNRRADILKQVDTTVRRDWLSSLRKFKRSIKVRAKIGVLIPIINAVKAENKRQHPDWDSEEWQDNLVTAIRTGDIPTPLLTGFVQSAMCRTWRAQGTAQEVLAEVDALCNTYSVQLRRKFGVFGDNV